MPDQTIGLYIKSDFFSRTPKKEIVAFFQILRIINSLEFWPRLGLAIEKDTNNLLQFRNTIELYFAMIAIYKESIKEFCNNLANGLLSMGLSEAVSQEISELKRWLDNWKQDEYLQVVDRIRNCLRFHLDPCIYDNYIKDGGDESKDLLVGVAVGERAEDFFFTEPYTFEFSYIAEIVPAASDEEKIDWILDRSRKETRRFIKLLKKVVKEILKGNAYKKIIDS